MSLQKPDAKQMMWFSLKLGKWLGDHKLEQKELAQKLGCKAQSVWNWLHRVNFPTKMYWPKIKEVTGIEITERARKLKAKPKLKVRVKQRPVAPPSILFRRKRHG